MSEENKPRKIKDLKARLGKTIAPTTGGIPGAELPPSGVMPGAAPRPSAPPPPMMGGAPPAPTVGSHGVGSPFGGGVVAPPFASKPAAQAAFDPFQGSPSVPPPQNEVRITFDDRPVEDAEVGRAKKGKNIILIAAGLVVGLLIGMMGGSVMSGRKLHNMAVRDGKEILESVRTASAKVEEAQRLIDRIAAAASGQNGPRSVDYEAVQQLQALEMPFAASTFGRKSYTLFDTATVDGLMDYSNRVGVIWSKFESLAAMTTGDARRAELNTAAAAADNITMDAGCLVMQGEQGARCQLGFLRASENEGKVMFRASTRARQEAERAIFTGGELGHNENVIIIDGAGSAGVMGQQATLFVEFAATVGGLRAQIAEAVEVQGRVEQGLGAVAANEEVFAF